MYKYENRLSVNNTKGDKILFISHFLILLGALFYTTNEFRILHYPLLLLGLFIIYIYTIKINCIYNNDKSIFLLVSLLFILMMISTAIDNWSDDLAVMTVGLYFVMVTVFVLLKNIGGIEKEKIFYNVNLILVLILVYIPVIFIGISIPYNGLTYNPNSFGNMTASLYAIFISIFFVSLEKHKLSTSIVINTILLALFCFLSISRTCIFTMLLLTIFFFIFYMKKNINNTKNRVKVWRNIFFSLIGMLVIFCLIEYSGAYEILEQKNHRRESDFTSGRMDIWQAVLSNITYFGLGRNFVDNFEIGYHNTYISFLAQFGLIPFIIFLIINFRLLFVSYKYFKKADSIYKGIPLSLGIAFFMMAFTEGLLMKYSMFAFYLSYACFSTRLNDYKKVQTDR